MKKLVISLLRRTDRKKLFQDNNLKNFQYIEAIDGASNIFRHITARKGWRDPFKNRKMLNNEVACFLSHIKAWKKCVEMNETVIVMEDDAKINALWNEKYFKELSKKYDFIYLQRNENEPTKVIPQDDGTEIPNYPYNMTAYVLTVKGAEHLLEQVNYDDFIPVDEFLPEVLASGSMSIVALTKDACNQQPRELGDIEKGETFRNYKVFATTCGTDRHRMQKLNTSAAHHGIYPINIGLNVDWRGTDMTARGGGMKINLMLKFLENKHDNDVVLFTDGYDVFYADNMQTILERFEDFDADMVFSSESICWPEQSLANDFPNLHEPYPYLNSGTYIGRVSALRDMMSFDSIEDDEDDQLFVQMAYLENIFDIKLDYEQYIFQTHEPDTKKLGNQLHNEKTGCCPCIYHGNGGADAEIVFNNLYEQFYPSQTPLFMQSETIEYLSKDMLVIDFMTQEQCERLIDIADKHGGWGSLSYDKFPAQEIRMKELGLWDELEKQWNEHVVPKVEQYWKPIQMYGLRDGFVMRYALDTQVSLNLHHDASLVTGSIKLNEDYVGAELIFPRQGISNTDIPVGKCILFPSQVTHGHECLPLLQGVKYSLTIWSCRYVNDKI